MIGLKGRLSVIDNSGALIAECINVLKVKTKKKSTGFAGVGASFRLFRDDQSEVVGAGEDHRSRYLRLPKVFNPLSDPEQSA